MNSLFLSIRDVTKVYPRGKKALAGVSLDIYHGEILSLLGANGAGKTTLSSIIASLHPATSGQVLYHGNSIYNDIIGYRKLIGYCPQKPNFNDALSVREHLLFAGRYHLMNAADIIQRSAELMEKFNLAQYADVSPSVLSGGYKQRLLLARALMHKPSLIILDEPTVALDPHIRRQLWEVIKDLKNMGVTVLLTTHYIDEAEILSDRICVLDQGLVRLIDTPANLMSTYSKGKLEDVFLHIMKENEEDSAK